ncbi:MAG TPA: endonuclease/exonuclease/phosphatase family protein [Polyangiaceae bacterium]|nr:endonuclease/exonuclease/phosphatase family protein [Polyangiaceae bacterium]
MGLSLATFNVKDLLPPASDTARAALPAKLDWIARMLRAVDADVVGLQEVGSAELLAAVAERMGSPTALHQVMGTTDARGIGCALLSRLPVLETRVHTAESLAFPVFVAGDSPPFGARIPLRRGIVHTRVETPVGPVDVLVAHFKSSRPVGMRDASNQEVPPRTAREAADATLRSLVWRAAEALYVRGLVDQILEARPGARVAVTGDFNDVPHSTVLRCLRADAGAVGALADCTTGVDPARRFSCFHGDSRVQIDHVLASESLRALLVGARFFNDSLRVHDVTDTLAPDSDHAPLVVRFG